MVHPNVIKSLGYALFALLLLVLGLSGFAEAGAEIRNMDGITRLEVLVSTIGALICASQSIKAAVRL